MPRKVYDSTYRTMAQKLPKLFVPLINEAFDRDYQFDSRIIQHQDRFRSGGGWIETDSVFELGNSLYHIECQTKNSGQMALRMLEYGFQIAAQRAAQSDGIWELELPIPLSYICAGHRKGSKRGSYCQMVAPCRSRRRW